MKKPTFKKPRMKRPTLPSMKPAPDPLKGLPPADTVEEEAAQELSALESGFRERAKVEADRFADATDTGYFTTLVCENRDQLDSLLSGLRALGVHIPEDMFIDGRELAAALKIDLAPGSGRGGSAAKIDKDFAGFSRNE